MTLRLLCLPVVILLVSRELTSPCAPGGPSPAAQVPVATSARDEDAIARGRRTYTKVGCYQCHGREGQGSPASGPRIGPVPPPLATFLAYVRAPAGEMPPYTVKVLSDAELTDIRAFLEARAPAVSPSERGQ